jgi:hypothetical protein
VLEESDQFSSSTPLHRNRYFKGKPLYPFGYGLSYTTFSYTDLTLLKTTIGEGDPVTAEATITNTGKREGDEVAQLYLSFPSVPGAPLRALRGFKRVHLSPGESQKVRFELKDRDLSMVSEAGVPIIAEGSYQLVEASRLQGCRRRRERFRLWGRRRCRSRNTAARLLERELNS